MRMRTTTDEERDAAQARLESWARGEDTESLRALAEHLAAGQASSMSQVDVEHYTTTLRTVVDIDIHHAFEVDAEALAAWLKTTTTNRAIMWDGVWLDVSSAEDFDHFLSIRLDAAYVIPDTSPIPAHPEHGPSHHLRTFTRGRCALCDHLHGHAPPFDMITVQSSLLPGATTHPTDEHTTRLYAINHEDTP